MRPYRLKFQLVIQLWPEMLQAAARIKHGVHDESLHDAPF